MKRLIFLVLFVIPSFLFAQNPFPDYWAVVKRFFSLYHHDDTEGILGMARKNDGWHIQVLEPAGRKIKSDQLFWSQQKGRYQVLHDFLGADKETPTETKSYSYISGGNTYGVYGYARCVYYGYDGWDADIIKQFGNSTALNDSLMEGLARSYSSFASRYLWYQYGGKNESGDPLQIELGRLEMPNDERVKKVSEYLGRSTELYKKIFERNKTYETYVGNIALKYFNENFHGYMQLMMSNRPTEASVFLGKCQLPASDSIAARNMLHSMAENGILFTYGDNDTYPLLFLQEKYNIRKDVSVLNTNLLGMAAYLELLKRNNSVPFSFTASDYGKKNFDYLVYDMGTDAAKTQKLTDFVTGYSRLKKLLNGDDSIGVYETKRLYLSFAKGDTISIQLRPYMLMDELILYDIITSNFPGRPVYFSDYAYSTFPADHLQNAGIVWKLSEKTVNPMDASIATEQENYSQHIYKPPFAGRTATSTEYTYNMTKHINLYMAQVSYQLKSGNKSAAVNLIKQCFAPFGENAPYISEIDSTLTILYETGFEGLADLLAVKYSKTILQNWFEKIFTDHYNKDLALTKLEKIQAILKKYNRKLAPVEEAASRLAQY